MVRRSDERGRGACGERAVLSVGVIAVGAAPARAASTRAEYIAQVDPICESFVGTPGPYCRVAESNNAVPPKTRRAVGVALWTKSSGSALHGKQRSSRDTAWAIRRLGIHLKRNGAPRPAGGKSADYALVAGRSYAPMVFTLTVNGCGSIGAAVGLQASK